MAVLTTLAPVHLTKHEGLGNDFLIAVAPVRPLDAADARAWCNRRRGIGADGLIQLVPADEASLSAPRWTMTLWNADGSRAEISGNGIRCAAQALACHQQLDGPGTFDLDTDAGPRHLRVSPTNDPATVDVVVDMGPAKPGPADSDAWAGLGIGVDRQLGIDMGNPHLVALVADPDAHDIATVGAAVEAGYADGCNVHLIKVIDRANLALRVWERGAGVTEACGTGACAAAFAASTWGLVDGPVLVHMPGGVATVDASGDTVVLTGPARCIASVTVHG